MIRRSALQRFKLAATIGFALLTACGNNHWKDKAVANERVASERVGGFSDDYRRLYHDGLQHIYNQHQHVGSYTIGMQCQ